MSSSYTLENRYNAYTFTPLHGLIRVAAYTNYLLAHVGKVYR